jgi:hypothetical protein
MRHTDNLEQMGSHPVAQSGVTTWSHHARGTSAGFPYFHQLGIKGEL